jgi:outer membrane protein assembly factor BamA/autotransporter translocation and assembly factor TamB
MAAKRVLRKRILILGVVLLGVFLAAVLVLSSPPFETFLLNQADRYLNKRFQLSLQVERLQVHPLRLAVTVQGLELHTLPTEGASQEQVLTAQHLELDLPLSALIARKPYIQRLSVFQPNLNIRHSWLASLQALQRAAAPADSAPASQNFRIDDFRLEEGSVEYAGEQWDLQASLSGISLDLNHDLREDLHAGSLQATGGRVVFGTHRIELRRIEIRGRFRPDELNIDRFELDSDLAWIQASGRIIDIPTDPSLELDMRSGFELSGLAPFFPEAPPGRGELLLAGTLAGNISNPEFRGTLRGQDLVLADLTIPRLQAGFAAGRSGVTIPELRLTTSQGSMEGRAKLSLEENDESNVHLDWTGVTAAALTPMGIPEDLIPAAILEGSLEVQGNLSDPETLRGKGNLSLEPDLRTNRIGLPLGGLIQMEFGDRTLRLLPSELTFPGAGIRVSGTLGLSGDIQGRCFVESRDLAALRRTLLEIVPRLTSTGENQLSIPELQGSASVTLEMQGSRSSPRGSLSLRGSEIRVADIPLDVLELQAQGNPAGLRISRFRWESQAGLVEGSGWLPLDSQTPPPPTDRLFSALISRVDIAVAAGFSPHALPISGELSGRMGITDSVFPPAIEFELELRRPRWGDWILDTADLKGGFHSGRLDIESLNIHPGSGLISGRFSLDLEAGTYSALLEGKDVKPGELQAGGGGPRSRPAGTLDFTLEGQGGLTRPVFDLNLVWEDAGWGRFAVSRITLSAGADGTALRAKAVFPEGRTELAIQTSLPHPDVISGRFSTERLNLFSLGGESPAGPETHSELTLEAEFSVPLNSPLDAEVAVRGDRLFLKHRDLTLANEQAFRFGLRERALYFEKLLLRGNELGLSLDGSLSLEGQSANTLAADASLDLMLLEPFLPAGEISGRLEIQSRLSGSLASPRPSGRISLQSGGWTLSRLPVGIRDASMSLEWNDTSVSLRELHLGVGQGIIQAQGEIPTSRLLALLLPESSGAPASEGSLRIQFKGFNPRDFLPTVPHDIRDDIEGNLDGDFELSGDFGSLSTLNLKGSLANLIIGYADVSFEADQDAQLTLRDSVLRVSGLNLRGKNSVIQASGSLNLGNVPELDFQVTSSLDLGELTPLVERSAMGGQFSLEMNAKGPLSEPQIQGWARLDQGLVRVPDFGLLLTNLEGLCTLTPGRLQLSFLRGNFNGGEINARGDFFYRNPLGPEGSLELEAKPLQITYPEGFQAQVEGRMNLTAQQGQWQLTGDLRAKRMYYTQDHYPGRELWSAIRYRTPPSISSIPPLLRALNLELEIALLDPLVIDNNLADIEMTGNLQIKGTPAALLFSGYLANREVGELEVGGRTYQVEKINLNFPGKDIQEAVLDLSAHTYVTYNHAEIEITLSLTGPLNRLTYSLSCSPPPLSQTELASLLITGQGADRLKSEAANIIGNQMILYFTSPLASPLTNRIKDFLRAESVSLEPINITSEADPGARFTLRKGLIQNLDLVYSVDIGNTQLQTWILDFSLKKNFGIQAFQRDDGTYGGSLSHLFYPRDLLFWAKSPSVAKTRRPAIQKVDYTGDLVFEIPALARAAHSLRPGKTFDYRLLRRDSDRLTAFYKDRGYLNIFVDPKINHDTGGVHIRFEIIAGEPAALEFSGSPLPGSLKRKIRDSWNSRIPEEVRLSEAEKMLVRALQSRGYFQTRVTINKQSGPSGLVYGLSVDRGVRYRPGQLTLGPESPLSPQDIKKSLGAIPFLEGHPYWSLLTDFRRSRRRILDLLAELGYQRARVNRPRFAPNPATKKVDISLDVQPGLRTHVRSVQVNGQQSISERDLMQSLRLGPSMVFSPSSLAEDNNRILNLYRGRGFQDVVISAEVIRESPSQVDILFAIQEGAQHLVRSIDISGNRKTPDSFIRRELTFREGDPVDMEQLILSQKNLYDLGIFRTVSVHRDPGHRDSPQEVIQVVIEEGATLAFRYGVRYNSEEKFEGFGQMDLTNLWGRGRNGLLFYRQNERQKDFRFSLSDPYLFGRRFNTLHSFYYLEQAKSVFKSEEISYTLQQEHKLPRDFSLSYLYRIGRNRSYIPDWTGPFSTDITARVSEVQTFLIRDTRSDRLNAGRGHFLSLSLTYSPKFLGPDLPYIRFFGQYSHYLPLGSGLIWASNLRLGLAEAFDQVLLVFRRFFAGGANSLRGFERDAVGPYDPDLLANAGGAALFILNQELRFPLYKWIGGVLFYDVGNVYLKRQDFNPFDVRQGLGLGLRLDTPAALIRLDYAFNLFPKIGEPRQVFYFSIGQVF